MQGLFNFTRMTAYIFRWKKEDPNYKNSFLVVVLPYFLAAAKETPQFLLVFWWGGRSKACRVCIDPTYLVMFFEGFLSTPSISLRSARHETLNSLRYAGPRGVFHRVSGVCFNSKGLLEKSNLAVPSCQVISSKSGERMAIFPETWRANGRIRLGGDSHQSAWPVFRGMIDMGDT